MTTHSRALDTYARRTLLDVYAFDRCAMVVCPTRCCVVPSWNRCWENIISSHRRRPHFQVAHLPRKHAVSMHVRAAFCTRVATSFTARAFCRCIFAVSYHGCTHTWSRQIWSFYVFRRLDRHAMHTGFTLHARSYPPAARLVQFPQHTRCVDALAWTAHLRLWTVSYTLRMVVLRRAHFAVDGLH